MHRVEMHTSGSAVAETWSSLMHFCRSDSYRYPLRFCVCDEYQVMTTGQQKGLVCYQVRASPIFSHGNASTVVRVTRSAIEIGHHARGAGAQSFLDFHV